MFWEHKLRIQNWPLFSLLGLEGYVPLAMPQYCGIASALYDLGLLSSERL